jgi:ubiquinone/menaquinone biosynthesis C-methylase UbiE
LSEFTGERVIPELVDADLLNEHLARYRFAKHFADANSCVLDAGCGAGYGTAELAQSAGSVTGFDISSEAAKDARARYGKSNARFLQASCEGLPFAGGVFDLVTAFEVIEHLDHWRELLTETNRVLKPSGVLLVSTPNREYYAESRGEAGPNPFHVHEFDYEEFRQALSAVYPHVRIWTQNHAEAIVFSPVDPAGGLLEASGANDFAAAHFYLAACSQSPIAANDVFAWVPSSANLLRERERHIAKLEAELEKKDAWLRQTIDAHGELQRHHEAVTAELQKQNNWAAELNGEIGRGRARIDELQSEQDERLRWVESLKNRIQEFEEQARTAQAHIDHLEARAVRAETLDGELRRIESSRWFRMGAKLGVGPHPRDGQ